MVFPAPDLCTAAVIMFISVLWPITISFPLPSPNPFRPDAVGMTVGLVNIIGLLYAFLYQLTLSLGILRPHPRSDQLTLMCGSVIFGRLHLKFIIFLIL